MVECVHVVKTYQLGINDPKSLWFADGATWRPLSRNVRNSQWFQESDMVVAETSDLLLNWLQYLPGCRDDYDDYGDFSISFYINDVMREGWDENKLIETLELMATAVNTLEEIEAYDGPYEVTQVDHWGKDYQSWKCPALIPLPGMCYLENPKNLETHG